MSIFTTDKVRPDAGCGFTTYTLPAITLPTEADTKDLKFDVAPAPFVGAVDAAKVDTVAFGWCFEKAHAIEKAIATKHMSATGSIVQAAKGASAKKKAAKEVSKEDSQSPGPQRNRGDTKKTVRLADGENDIDWYDVLRVEQGEAADDEDIKLAYKKRCLETHPDKQPDKSDKVFKQVQRGFEILMNPDARRAYDSSRPFDDTIPEADAVGDEPDAFYKTFEPVMQRNAKWSIPHPVPALGNDDTPIAEVKKMYEFWLSFRSWRDFAHDVELERVEETMSREEKRYYQRENQRLVDKRKKEEVKRMRTLVDRAMAADPRLKRQREAEEAAKELARQEKEAAKQRREDEKRRKAEEAAAKEAAAKGVSKTGTNAQNEKKMMMVAVAKFLKANGVHQAIHTNLLLRGKVRQPNITWFGANASMDEVQACHDAVLASNATPDAALAEEFPPLADDDVPVPAALVFNAAMENVERRLGRNRYGEPFPASSPNVHKCPDFPVAVEA